MALSLAALSLAALGGCHRRRALDEVPAPSTVTAPPAEPVPLASVYVLEYSGTPPPDTTVTFATGEQRVVLLRAGPPDNTIFAEMTFPANAFGPDSGVAVTVRLHPRPGVYGLDFEADRPLVAGARLTFEFARYFSAPAAALKQYGGTVAYERALAIGRLLPNAMVQLLPSSRPASDNLQADIPATGSYIVAAPK